MIIDDVIWEIINNGHCSFKSKTETNTFCRNQHNLTGLCNRNSCPLANSRYSTIIEDKGVCYLYIKTAERAHTPNELWEKIKLDKSYNTALKQIDENLMYFPEFQIHKCKQRFTKIRQMLVRKRRLKLKNTEEYEVVSRKAEKREKSRLVKAEKSALIDKHIEEELLKNLKAGKYEIMNYPLKNWENVLDAQEIEQEDENEFDEENLENVFIEDAFGDDNEDNDDGDFKDIDELDEYKEDDKYDKKTNTSSKNKFTNKKRNRKNKLNLEYEYENEDIDKLYDF